MRSLFYPLAFLFITSCDQQEKPTIRSDEPKHDTVAERERIITNGEKRAFPYDTVHTSVDTTFPNGKSLLINFNLKTDKLTASIKTGNWDTIYDFGKAMGKRSIIPIKHHRVRWATNEFAGLREGCGSPCYYEVVIPLVQGKKPSSYFFPYTNADKGIYLSKNLIAYNGTSKSPDGYPVIKIKNLLNGKKDSLTIDSNWTSTCCMNEFIDTLYGTNSYFFIGQKDSTGNIIAKKSRNIDLNN